METQDRVAPWMAALAELDELLPRIDRAEFDELVKAFEDTDRRWFFSGQGRSGLSARMAAMRLMHIGRTSHVLGEVTAPSVREGDGMLFISGSGETPVTLSFARIAQDEGARLVVVTSTPDSTLAGLADVVLDVPVHQSAQLGGNLFETAALILLDSAINVLGDQLRDPHGTLRYRHTNMQ